MKSLKLFAIAFMVSWTFGKHTMAMEPPQTAEQVNTPIKNPMFVLNSHSSTVSVIDTENLRKIGEDIDVGLIPNLATFSLDGKRLFVFNSQNSTVSVIDTENLRKIGEDIPVGLIPNSATLSVDGKRLFVTDNVNNFISVIDTENLSKITDIHVGVSPNSATLSVDGKHLFMVNGRGNSVSVIDTENLSKITDIHVGVSPNSATLSVDGKRLFVVNSMDHSVSVIDTENFIKIKDIPVGEFPRLATLSVDGKRLFVANKRGNSISVIDTENFINITDIRVGVAPISAILSVEGKHLFVTNVRDSTVSVIDTENLSKITDIPVGQTPRSPILSVDGKRLFVANVRGNSISVIDTENLSKITDIPVGNFPELSVIYKPKFKLPECVTMLHDVAGSISNGTLAGKDIPLFLPILQDVREALPAIPFHTVNDIVAECFLLLDVFKKYHGESGSISNAVLTTMDFIALENFYMGAREKLTSLNDESTFNNDAFHGAYASLMQPYGHFQGLNSAYKIKLPLNEALKKIANVLQSHPRLLEIEKKVLEFIGLQMLTPFMIENDVAASKDLRLQLLHFIDGYNLGDIFEIPLPGMEEDQRTVKDFIRLIGEGKF